MLIARLLAGRLCEGWKILSHFSKPLKAEYEPEMEPEGRRALQEIRAYFNPKRGQECLIWKVRDHIAFHSLSETVEAAYALFEPTDDLGDYLAPTFGNTLYYTTELLQYRALQHLSGADDHTAALDRLITDTQRMTSAFNTAIYAFAGVFFKRFLPIPLSNLMAEAETIDVPSFEDQCLTFFSELPVS
ncbi:conserved hypothetical protein [Altererythrobacter sp. B11]|nr:conserved hypothetical protein [Altererythrobacter sp. B11]